MAKKSKEPGWSQKDQQLWDLTTQSVTPLKPRKSKPKPHKAQTASLLDQGQAKAPDSGVFKKPSRSKSIILKPVGPQKTTSFTFNPAVQNLAPQTIEPSILKKVRRKRLAIDATLDLHGLTQIQAESALQHFIENGISRGFKTLLVITGKGIKSNDFGNLEDKGVLKRSVPVWLSKPPLSPYISGVSQAANHHGGAGALYVRLKS